MNEAEGTKVFPALPDPAEEDRLLEAAHEGSDAAFAEIIDAYFDRVYDYAGRLSGDSALAGTVAALTLHRLAASSFILGESNRLAIRLFTIARDLTLDRLAGEAAGAETGALPKEPEQSALDLHQRQGLAVDEVAQVLDLDDESVASLLSTARSREAEASDADPGEANARSALAEAERPPADLADRVKTALLAAWPAMPAAQDLITLAAAEPPGAPPAAQTGGEPPHQPADLPDNEATTRYQVPPEYPVARPPRDWAADTGFLPPPPPDPPPTRRGGLGPLGRPLLIGLLFGMLVTCGVLTVVVVNGGLLAGPPATPTTLATATATATATNAPAAVAGTDTATATGTATTTPTATSSTTGTAAVTPSATGAATGTPTVTATTTVTPTVAATPTATPTVPATATSTAVPPTATATPPPATATATATATAASATATPTVTPAATTGTAVPTPDRRVSGSLEVQPARVSFGPGDAEYTLAVINRGAQPLGWQAAPSVPWLAVDPAGGILPPGNEDPLTIMLRRDLMPAGAREATVVITADTGRIELPITVAGS